MKTRVIMIYSIGMSVELRYDKEIYLPFMPYPGITLYGENSNGVDIETTKTSTRSVYISYNYDKGFAVVHIREHWDVKETCLDEWDDIIERHHEDGWTPESTNARNYDELKGIIGKHTYPGREKEK